MEPSNNEVQTPAKPAKNSAMEISSSYSSVTHPSPEIRPSTPEETPAINTLQQGANAIVKDAYDYYGHMHGKVERKYIHSVEHPHSLDRRAHLIADVLGLSEDSRSLISIDNATHDLVMDSTPPSPDDLLGMIKRARGAREGDLPSGIDGNEAKSAAVAREMMEKVNQDARREIFTQEHINTVTQGIEVTYPDADLGPDYQGKPFAEYDYYQYALQHNPELAQLFQELTEKGILKGNLFFQPHLEKALEAGENVPPEVLTMALVDLGAAGMEDFEVFRGEGNGEFKELYANLTQRKLAELAQSKDETLRTQVSDRFLGWIKSQVGFAAFQALRFEKIMSLVQRNRQIAPELQEKILSPEFRQLFSHYPNNVCAALERASAWEKKIQDPNQDKKSLFIELTKEMGYTDEPDEPSENLTS